VSRILVIDDDPTNREILRSRLEMAGHEVTEAPNGEEGLRLLEEAASDLVILDVMMPRVDGWQICRQIKTNPKTNTIPVVMLTALGQQIDQLRGWESGADDYLTKPWDPAKLLELVEKWCLTSTLQKPNGTEKS
jgi:DNA-binding response OmpR family regulator